MENYKLIQTLKRGLYENNKNDNLTSDAPVDQTIIFIRGSYSKTLKATRKLYENYTKFILKCK